jgi:hypothetical protein
VDFEEEEEKEEEEEEEKEETKTTKVWKGLFQTDISKEGEVEV